MVFLASYGAFGGGSIGSMLSQWEAAGIFTYALPFLLIFAIVFSVLSSVQVFKGNKPVNAVISLAVALLALQFQIVSIFFAEIFPRLGIALSVLLVVVILGSMFTDPTKDKDWIRYVLIGVTVVVILVVVGGSFSGFGFGFGGGGLSFLYGVNWGGVLIGALIIGLIIWVIASGNSGKNKGGPPKAG
jgi:hypothetical protein